MRQAIRLFGTGRDGTTLTKGDLVTIEADDVLKSRVFEGGFYKEREPDDHAALEPHSSEHG